MLTFIVVRQDRQQRFCLIMQIILQIKFTYHIRLTILQSSMLRKNLVKTWNNTFYSSDKKQLQDNSVLGEPYTEYPVPVDRASFAFNSSSKQNNKQVFNGNSQYKAKKLQSADCKYRNPGLMNIGRKINLNNYVQQNQCGEAQAIRRLGMNYSRKLQHRYNKVNFNAYNNRISTTKNKVSRTKLMKDWYQQRSQGLQNLFLQFMKKIQVKLADNCTTKEQREEFMKEINKNWEQETPAKLKKCFEN